MYYIFGLDKSIGLEYDDQRVAKKSRYEYFLSKILFFNILLHLKNIVNT